MPRRLAILLVDALVFAIIAGVVMLIFRLDTRTSEAAEPTAEPAFSAQAQTDLGTLPPGTLAVSARVVAESSRHLIMPGDTVDVTRRAGGEPLLKNASVLRIDPPLMAGDDRLHITFALEPTKAARLRNLREEELLFVRLAGVHVPEARQGFEPPRPAEVIVLRFEDERWARRLTAQ
ncbi:hypothetical protein HK107_09130 [Parvularcula sp. ZS-1/3]|uniref:Flp pilus assembly protein RcpC/CpaB domain-containing protein n=1 Tax=Parvularcula mediterranea TaxID=2732508 RepID=A0A7Y3RMU1_9PROT|nr:hypothetical protein [Parvularcula mediterranea]NNU16481.1 hypothetical protein [Parvularcula mediterranea]